MKLPLIPAELPEPIRAWAEQFHMLAAASGLSSQRQLADELKFSAAAMSRYLTAKRLPDRSTVTTLIELVRANGGTVDELTVFRAYAIAEEVWPERQRRQNGHPSPLMSSSDDQDTGTSNHHPAERENGDGGPANVAHRTDRNRHALILVKAGIAALIIATAGVGISSLSGAFHTDDPQTTTPAVKAHCVAESCAGKNHNEQGCGDDARALPGGRDNGTAIVEVMYSPTCHAAWGKAKGVPNGAVVKVTDMNGLEQRALGKAVAGEATPKPTPMLAAPAGTELKACIMTNDVPFCTDTVEISAN